MDVQDYIVFERYRRAPANAFGSKKNPASIVTEEDKRSYGRIFEALRGAASAAMRDTSSEDVLTLKEMNFSPQYGSRGHRPVDMWIAVCGADSEPFGRMPQVYVIASRRGVEFGFAISINEADYHDQSVKARNRSIVPAINRKLPHPASNEVSELTNALEVDGGWYFNLKARLSPGDVGFDQWASVPEMIEAIKLGGSSRGGGSVAKFLKHEAATETEIIQQFGRMLEIFLPLLLRCQASSLDAEVAVIEKRIERLSATVISVTDERDARERIFREIAARRGQSKFRKELIEAYEGRCAVSGVELLEVLEAAHILPYRGDHTNICNNGILLRADLHTLFDLGLMLVDPDTLRVVMSDALAASEYYEFHMRDIRLPNKFSLRPNPEFFRQRNEIYTPSHFDHDKHSKTI